MRDRAGFSLVECLVASVVLVAGLLALSASGRAMQRLDALGGSLAGAAQAAASRFAALKGVHCPLGATGSAAGRYSERWSATLSGALVLVTLDVTFSSPGAPRTVRFQASWPCPP